MNKGKEKPKQMQRKEDFDAEWNEKKRKAIFRVENPLLYIP